MPRPHPEGDLDRRAFIIHHSASTRDDAFEFEFEFDAFDDAFVRSFLDVRPSIRLRRGRFDVDDADGPRAKTIELARVRRER